MQTDKYPDLDALKAHLRRNEHYRIRCLDRESRITIVSPHGGFIEPGTSAIAGAIAGRKYNLFDFQGLSPELARDMHVTSTRFRDPDLTRLLNSSEVIISIHGMGDITRDTIWLGGLNGSLKELVLAGLSEDGFSVNPRSPLYRGERPENLVNGSCRRGVQIELPEDLLSAMFERDLFTPFGPASQTTEVFHNLVGAVRLALRRYRDLPERMEPCHRLRIT